MIELPKIFKSNKKTLAIGLASTIIVVLLGILALVYIANQNHKSNLQLYGQQMRTTISESATQFKALALKPDTKLAIDNFKSLVLKLETAGVDLPKDPQILGLNVIDASNMQLTKRLEASLGDLLNTLKVSESLLIYEQSVSKLLDTVIGKSGNNLAEQRALSKSWAKSLSDIKKLTPPEIAKQQHEILIKNITEISKAVSKLPTLYEKVDIKGFASQQKAIAGQIGELQEVGEAHGELSVGQDRIIASQLSNLITLINSI